MKRALFEERNPPRVALLIESSRSYGRDLLMGIAKYVRIQGHWSVEFEEGDPCEQFPQWFDRWQWDGIIARIKTPAIARAVAKCGVPVVDLSGCLPDSAFPTIRSDEKLVGRLAAEHLIERGFKNFAFCGLNGIQWSDLRFKGYENRLAESGFSCRVYAPPRPPQQDSTLEYEEHGEIYHQELSCWLKSLPTPTGLMACNDSRARQILNCCRDANVVVPDELAVIGVDKDEIFCELSDLPLSSVILNAQQIGYEAAALLDRLMAGECAGTEVVTVKPLGVSARRSTDVLAIEDRHIAGALRCIRERACHGLDVDSLLNAVPLSRSVLERRFAQILGSSPKAEILRVRLNRVSQLLVESDLPLAEVAAMAGFDNPEYMSRLFKKKIGTTPGEFRKQAGAGRLQR